MLAWIDLRLVWQGYLRMNNIGYHLSSDVLLPHTKEFTPTAASYPLVRATIMRTSHLGGLYLVPSL